MKYRHKESPKMNTYIHTTSPYNTLSFLSVRSSLFRTKQVGATIRKNVEENLLTLTCFLSAILSSYTLTYS